MLLGGLWHGAAWSYMVWGGAHGLLLALERFFGVKGEVAHKAGNTSPITISPLNPRPSNPFVFKFRISSFTVRVVRILLIFNVVSFLWLLFQLPNFGEVILYMKELAAWNPGMLPQPVFAILFFSTPIVLYHIWGASKSTISAAIAVNWPETYNFCINFAYAVLLFLIVTNSGSPGAFIYFQF